MKDRRAPVSIRSVIKELGIPKSTAYQLIHTLVEQRLVEQQDPGLGYSLGARLFELGMVYGERSKVQRRAAQGGCGACQTADLGL